MATSDHRPETHSLRRRIVEAVISVLLVAAIFGWALPQFADYSDVWKEISAMTWLEVATLVLVALWNLVTYWFVLVAVLPGLTYSQAAVANQASTAVANTVPGGGALGVGVTYAMYSSWGFTNAEFALSTLVSGVWNTFAKLGMPVLALALLALTGDIDAAKVAAAAAGIAMLVGAVVVFALILRSERLARAFGGTLSALVNRVRRLTRRAPVTDWGEAASRFRHQTNHLLETRWLRLTIATAVSHLSLYVVLLVALRHVGVSQDDVGWVQVLAVYSFVRLISALPITPGGVGVVELGYTAGLTVGLDATTDAQVVAAVLVFRAVTFLMPVPLGAAAYLIWQRKKSWRRSSADRTAEAAAP